MGRSLQVFEHKPLEIVKGGLEEKHFERLVRYNEIHGCKYFDVGHKKIIFKNYVGVIQVGSLTIEILPKADNSSEPSKAKWQKALIHMLRRSGLLKLDSLSKAALRIRSANLLDLYIESFLAEVNRLVHEGLIRKYRHHQGNITCLKGKLLFSKQIAHNYIHKERFYTQHTLFDQNNHLNGILKSALTNVAKSNGNPHLSAKAKALLLDFEGVKSVSVSEDTFKRLRYDRNSERYRYPMQLAKLILLEYLPDVKGGREDVLAILFDMNALFERYIFAELKRAESIYSDLNLHFSSQKSRPFWGNNRLRPDILAEFYSDGKDSKMILDTKWKTLSSLKPSVDDLRQMYAYNLHFGSSEAFLLYPRANFDGQVFKHFEASGVSDNFRHGCGMYFADLFDDKGDLRSDLGDSLIRTLIIEKSLF